MTTRRSMKKKQLLPVRMSPSCYRAFTRALAEPATAVPQLVEVLKRLAPWEVGPSRK